MPVTPRTIEDIINQLAGIFFPGFNGGTLTSEGLAAAQQSFTQNLQLTNFLSAALSDSDSISTHPKAFLTWLLLDNRYNLIPAASGVLKAENPDELGNLAFLNLSIPENGYLYLYVSNESGGRAVDFDNLQLQHVPGYVMEENHYYPYGLLIEPISFSVSWRRPRNAYKYQDKERELALDLNQLDFHARYYDPVLGRWHVQDPAHQHSSSYLAMGNNPVSMIDPDGMISMPHIAQAIIFSLGDGLGMAVNYRTHGYDNPWKAFKSGAKNGFEVSQAMDKAAYITVYKDEDWNIVYHHDVYQMGFSLSATYSTGDWDITGQIGYSFIAESGGASLGATYTTGKWAFTVGASVLSARASLFSGILPPHSSESLIPQNRLALL